MYIIRLYLHPQQKWRQVQAQQPCTIAHQKEHSKPDQLEPNQMIWNYSRDQLRSLIHTVCLSYYLMHPSCLRVVPTGVCVCVCVCVCVSQREGERKAKSERKRQLVKGKGRAFCYMYMHVYMYISKHS